jgi:hypothetical protein
MRDTQFGRWGFQRGGHDRGVIQCARAARARPIAQPADTRAVIACPPSEHRGRETPTRDAISVFDTPSAASSTIRARCANPAGTDDARVSATNFSPSSSRKPNGPIRTCDYRKPHCQITFDTPH